MKIKWILFYQKNGRILLSGSKSKRRCSSSIVDRKASLPINRLFLAACASMDIDATPMEGIFPEQYDQILGIEKGYKTLCAVLIGYRDEKDENQPSKTPKQRLEFNKIIRNL